jgi:hypothetical protein
MNNKESKALLEVWEWKETAYKEVENMELKRALKERMDKSIITAEKLNFKTVSLIHK